MDRAQRMRAERAWWKRHVWVVSGLAVSLAAVGAGALLIHALQAKP